MDSVVYRWHGARAAIELIAQRTASLRDPKAWAHELRPCFTRAGGALAFDIGVFLMLGLLAWSLLTPWEAALSGAARLMLIGVGVFALLWWVLCEPDLRRFLTLRRRWHARPRTAAPPARRVTSRPRPSPPPRVRSAYRPVREALHSRSLWRVDGGSRG